MISSKKILSCVLSLSIFLGLPSFVPNKSFAKSTHYSSHHKRGSNIHKYKNLDSDSEFFVAEKGNKYYKKGYAPKESTFKKIVKTITAFAGSISVTLLIISLKNKILGKEKFGFFDGLIAIRMFDCLFDIFTGREN